MKNIGIIGRKRSGKDTAAAALVEHHGYARHALADPLKAAALALDPIVTANTDKHGEPNLRRLREIVHVYGWERAKDRFSEVRRILQRLGDEAGRQVHGEYTWIDQLMTRVEAENVAGRPVVVPDVRFPNEAEHLAECGFLLVRITRPTAADPTDNHPSECQIGDLTAHAEIVNAGTIDDLGRAIRALIA